MIRIVKVTNENFLSFKCFVPNCYKLNESDICFGAISGNDVPCAVILAKHEGKGVWCVTDFFVFSKARNIGIGSTLLSSLENELIKVSCSKMYFKLIVSEKNMELISDFLKKRGFSKIEKLCRIYKKNSKLILEESTFTKYILKLKNISLQRDFKLIRLKDITNTIKEGTVKEEVFAYPALLSPFANEYKLEDANSLFILDTVKNKLVAWLTAFYAPGDCILYRSFFVNREYKEYNFGKLLLKKAVEKHKSDFFNKNLLFAVSLENEKVNKVLTKYFTMTKENLSYEVIID